MHRITLCLLRREPFPYLGRPRFEDALTNQGKTIGFGVKIRTELAASISHYAGTSFLSKSINKPLQKSLITKRRKLGL